MRIYRIGGAQRPQGQHPPGGAGPQHAQSGQNFPELDLLMSPRPFIFTSSWTPVASKLSSCNNKLIVMSAAGSFKTIRSIDPKKVNRVIRHGKVYEITVNS